MRILIVEDEIMLADTIGILLQGEGYDVDKVHDGVSGLEYAETGIYDLMVLDVMMPGMNGFEVARALRAKHNGTPILMLTARSELEDRIVGLDSGADYYLTKPFDNRELLACVNALIRRQGNEVDVLTMGNTSLDINSAVLSTDDGEIRLSAKEFEIMRLLMSAKEQITSKEAILIKVWGFESDAVENNVEVYVGFLRKKLRAVNSNVNIESIRMLGYHLEIKQ